MKKNIITLLLFFTLPAICLADFSPQKWQYYKDVNEKVSGLAQFSIDDEIFSNTKSDLQDLRVISNNGKEVPYKLVVGESKVETTSYSPQMLNNSYAPGDGSSVILDFGGSNTAVNTLTINTRSENFQRNVKIYGSDDMNNWRVVKENIYIYDYTDKKAGFKSQNTTINFPESVFRYLKIEITDPVNEPVIIDSVSAKQYIRENVKEVVREPRFTKEVKDGNTEIKVDMGSGGIPLGKIALNAKSVNFNRSLVIYSSYNQADWRQLGQSYIFRYDTPKFRGENLTLNFSETKDRYIKILIINKDDEPLDIAGLKTFSVYRQVVFAAKAEESYRIYYGNPNARGSEYDLEKYFQYLDAENAINMTLSAQKINKEYASAAKSETEQEKYPYLMPVSLIVISILLLFLIYKFFQKK